MAQNKQKKLLEDSIIIHRIKNSPERRVFWLHENESNDEVLKDFDKMKDAMIQKCAETRNKR